MEQKFRKGDVVVFKVTVVKQISVLDEAGLQLIQDWPGKYRLATENEVLDDIERTKAAHKEELDHLHLALDFVRHGR